MMILEENCSEKQFTLLRIFLHIENTEMRWRKNHAQRP